MLRNFTLSKFRHAHLAPIDILEETKLFEKFDKNQDGYINLAELK